MTKRLHRLFCILLLIVLYINATAQSEDKVIAGISSERLKRYEAFINAEVENGNIPGATTLVMRDNQVVYQGAFGYKALDTKTPMKADDIFFIQSMTKPVITVAFMMLYEEGHFALTDPVSKYIPEFADLKVSKDPEAGSAGETEPLKSPVTMADLLSHTSGITHGLGTSKLDREFIEQYFKTWPDVQSRMVNIFKFPLVAQPGTRWYYSPTHDVVSVLIERFSGKSTEAFLNDRIFKPLGMKDTGYNLTKAQQSRVVKVHRKSETGALIVNGYQPQMEGNTVWSGVNGLYSTAGDYMKFCQMLLNGGVFDGRQYMSRKTIELMTLNRTGDLLPRDGEGFGLGFAIVTDVAKTGFPGSTGTFYWEGAFNTHFFIDPKEKLVAVFMTQITPFSRYHHLKMRQLIYQAIVK